MQLGEAMHQHRRMLPKRCSHPEANAESCGKIINAHTVSSAQYLQRIATDQHVYSFIPSASELEQWRFSGQVPRPKRHGINQASTFTGFCALHDRSTFRPIDDSPFVGSAEQVFLLSYRSVCREAYAKAHHLDFLTEVVRNADRGRDPAWQGVVQKRVAWMEEGAERGGREVNALKAAYDERLLCKDFGDLAYYLLEFQGTPVLACSGSGQVLHDAAGNVLQDLSESSDMEALSLNLLPTETGGVAALATVGAKAVWSRVVDSFEALSDANFANALIHLAFFNFENVFANPKWWDALPAPTRSFLHWLVARAHPGMHSFPPFPEGTPRLVDWKLTSQQQIG